MKSKFLHLHASRLCHLYQVVQVGASFCCVIKSFIIIAYFWAFYFSVSDNWTGGKPLSSWDYKTSVESLVRSASAKRTTSTCRSSRQQPKKSRHRIATSTLTFTTWTARASVSWWPGSSLTISRFWISTCRWSPGGNAVRVTSSRTTPSLFLKSMTPSQLVGWCW